jgi:hypothetical protein
MVVDKTDESDEPSWSYEIYVDEEINVTFLDTHKFRRMILEHRLGIFLHFNSDSSKKLLNAYSFLLTILGESQSNSHSLWTKMYLESNKNHTVNSNFRSTSWEVNRTWAKAKRRISHGDLKKGKKELFHALSKHFPASW